ncbi:hypothetical protein ACKC9G_18315 [Pokkaliibacter sp. CJK22405]|uniref:hypothetical protein n=1 Tax=Pokkaliibacter sp. CJK22405 TaxID=3384615 RepID=UPI00398505C7
MNTTQQSIFVLCNKASLETWLTTTQLQQTDEMRIERFQAQLSLQRNHWHTKEISDED